MTDRHWEKLESARRLKIMINYDSDSYNDTTFIRRLLSLRGCGMEIKTSENLVSDEYLDLLETVDCLVSYRSIEDLMPDESGHIYPRLFDILYRHRATLKKLSMGDFDIEFRKRWLQLLEELPVAKYSHISSVDIPEADIPLYYSKLTGGNVTARMTHFIDSAKESQHFTEYLATPIRATQSRDIMLQFYNGCQCQVIKPLLQHAHFEAISLGFYNIEDYPDEKTVTLDLEMADNIQRLSIHFDSVSFNKALSFKGFYAPSLKDLTVSNDDDPSDLIFDALTPIIGSQVPNLLRLSIKMAHSEDATPRKSFKKLLDSVSSHPTLQWLELHNIDHPDLISQSIHKSSTIIKITVTHRSLDKTYVDTMSDKPGLFQSTFKGKRVFEGYRVLDNKTTIKH
eukprot:gene17288-20619_t